MSDPHVKMPHNLRSIQYVEPQSAAAFSRQPRDVWKILYNDQGVCLDIQPDPMPPWTRREVVGVAAWRTIRPECIDGFRSAFQRAVDGESIVWDVGDTRIGWWRTWMTPVDGVLSVAVSSLVRRFPPAVSSLTEKERKICAQLAAGQSSKQIAVAEGLARSTVDNRRNDIAAKLGIIPGLLVAWSGLHAEWLA